MVDASVSQRHEGAYRAEKETDEEQMKHYRIDNLGQR